MSLPPRRRRRSFEWSTVIVGILAIGAGTTVLIRDGWDHFREILLSDTHLLINILPKTFAGCLIGAFVTLLLPREVVTRLVGAESGLSGLLIAMAMGALLPGGPFTIYPVAGAFLLLGADVGTAIAFITSWSLLGYNRALVWEFPFMGPDFVMWRMIAAVPLPLLAGLLGRYVGRLIVQRGGKPWV